MCIRDRVCTFKYRISFINFNFCYFSVFIGIDVVFHLHSLKDDDRLASLHGIPFFHFYVEDNAQMCIRDR